MSAKTFGERLKKLIKFQGYSCKDISDKTGIHQSRMSHYIHDKQQPNLEHLKALCKALNCRADYLLGLDQEAYPNELMLLRNTVKEIKDIFKYS